MPARMTHLRPQPNRPTRRRAWMLWLLDHPLGVTVEEAHQARVRLGFEDNRACTTQALRHLSERGAAMYRAADGNADKGLVIVSPKVREELR